MSNDESQDLGDFGDFESEADDEPSPDFIGDDHPGQTHVVPDVDPENSEDELVEDYRESRAEEIEAAKERGVEQFDATLGMDFDVPPEQIQAFARSLDEAEAFDAEEADDETLAEYSAALKALENAAEEARKEVFEDELDGRTEIDDEVGPLVKTRGSRRYVSDEDAAIEAIEDAGGDPMQAMSMKASDAADLLEALGLEPDEFIGRREYSYFRRQL